MNTLRVRRLLPLLGMAVASLAFGANPPSVTPPAVMLTDGTNTVTIDSTGAVIMSPGCACTTTATPVVSPGNIGWSGTVGAFTVTGLLGESKPALMSPSIDIGITELDSTTNGGSLTVSWTDTDFTGIAPSTIATLTNYLGSGSTTYKAYVDPSNTPFGTAVLVNSVANATDAQTQASSTALPAGAFSMTATEVITLGAGGLYSNDFGFYATAAPATPPPSPMISLTKTASAAKVNPFQKVTYTYVVKNAGNVALTNLTVTDDNATPAYAGDDFTVCTIASLAAGASQTCTASAYPPITEGANDSKGWNDWGGSGWGGWGYNAQQTHAGGTLICKSKPNGNVEFTYLVDENVTDNSYGRGSNFGWGWFGDSLANMLNDGAEFQILDAQGNKVLDFVADYVSPSPSYPSGYGTMGVKGGGGMIYAGSSSNIVKIDTSITDNLNLKKAFYKCTQNSPTGNPNWENKYAYKVEISSRAWGSRGFGGVACPVVKHHSKTAGCAQHEVKPTSSVATNTATVIAYYGRTELTASARASVSIDASPQGWSQCARY